MIDKEIQFRKKRELDEIISDTFKFLNQEKRILLKLIINYVLPFIILYALALFYFQKNIFSKINISDTEKLLSNIGPVYLNLALFTLFGVFVQSLLVGTFYSYLEIYIKKGKGNFELSEVTSLLFSNGLLALRAGIFIYVAILLGTIMCILPGIYFANTFSIAAFVFIFEKQGFNNAVIRSAKLVNSFWWNTFILNFTGIVLIWAVGFVFTIPSLIAGISVNIFELNGVVQPDLPTWFWILNGVSTIFSSVLWIIPYTFLAFQYFNLEERLNTRLPKIENLN